MPDVLLAPDNGLARGPNDVVLTPSSNALPSLLDSSYCDVVLRSGLTSNDVKLYRMPAPITAGNNQKPSLTNTVGITATLGGVLVFARSFSDDVGPKPYIRTITFNHTLSGTADITNFPALISGTYSYLATAGANGGQVINSNGYDVQFWADSGMTQKLNWQTELYTAANGQVIYWVKIPNLSHTVDTVIYMSYGDASISTDQSTPTAVWDSSYLGVYHMGTASSLDLSDAKNINNGTNHSAVAAAGKINGAFNSDGVTTYANLGVTGFAFSDTQPFTFEGWIASTDNKPFLGTTLAGGTASSVFLSQNAQQAGAHAFEVTIGNFATGHSRVRRGGTVVDDGVMRRFMVTYDGSGSASGLNISLNGTPETMTQLNNAAPDFAYDNTQMRIGSIAAGYFANITLDEFRISNLVRSTSYDTACTNNQTTPATFYTIGAQSTTGDSLAAGRLTFPRAFANTVGVTETISGHLTFARAFADAPGITDTLLGHLVFARPLADTVGITETLSGRLAFARAFADTVGITDTMSRAPLAFARALTDTVGITDTLNGRLVFARSFADTTGITDTLSGRLVFARALADTVGITDSLSRHLTFARAISDTVGITETLAGRLIFARSLADTLGITDTLSGHLTFPRSFSDTIGLTDTLSGHLTMARSISDTLGITDSLARRIVFLRSFADAPGITDAFSTHTVEARGLLDTVGFTDTLGGHLIINRSFPETVGLTETLSGRLVFARSFSDTTGITDSLTRHLTFARSFSETIGITDTISGHLIFLRSLADTVGITDTLSRHLVFLRSFADTVGITDTMSGQVVGGQHDFTAALADTVGITDTLARHLTFSRSFANTIAITDTLARHLAFVRSIANTVAITDILHQTHAMARSLTDTVGILDGGPTAGDGIFYGGETTGFGGTGPSPGGGQPANTPLFQTSILSGRVGNTETVLPVVTLTGYEGDPTFSRIDSMIFVNQGPFGNPFVVGESWDVFVIPGTASASPVPPTLPYGSGPPFNWTAAVRIANILVPPNAVDSSECTITDTREYIGRQKLTFHRSFTETVGITDIQREAKRAALANTVGIVDALTGRGTRARALTDTVGILDALAEHVSKLSSFFENVGITDSLHIPNVLRASFTDEIGITGELTIKLLLNTPDLEQPLLVIIMTNGENAVIMSDAGVTSLAVPGSDGISKTSINADGVTTTDPSEDGIANAKVENAVQDLVLVNAG